RKGLKVSDVISRHHADLQHRLAGPVDPRGFKTLTMCPNNFPEMTGYPKNLVLRAAGAPHAQFVNFRRGLSGVRLLGSPDDLVDVWIRPGVFAVIGNELHGGVRDDF